MKILLICTEKLPVPAVRGGAIQTYIDGVSHALAKNHDLTILGTTDPSLPNDERVNNIRYVRTPGGLLEDYRHGVKQFLQSESTSYDVIHIFNRPRLVLAVRECAPNARIVLSMHNDMFKRQKIEPEEAEAAIEQLDKIVTVSDYIGKTISDLFPKAAPKLKTIYSGVDIDRFVPPNSQKALQMRQEIRKEHELEGKKVILFAGRLSANKGADILVEAMPLLAKKHPDIALVLVGSKWFSVNEVSDYVAYVRALAARIQVPVVNTGFISPTEIQKWFAAADVFVCPSQWQEPLARVHYEAMASGLPIVTTARGGNPEVITQDENGYVVDQPEDPQAFADLLSPLLSNPKLCKTLGQNGRKLAEEKFTWSRVINDISDVWDEIQYKITNNITINAEQQDEENEASLTTNLIAAEEVLPEAIDAGTEAHFDTEAETTHDNSSDESNDMELPEEMTTEIPVEDNLNIDHAEIVNEPIEKQPTEVQSMEDIFSYPLNLFDLKRSRSSRKSNKRIGQKLRLFDIVNNPLLIESLLSSTKDHQLDKSKVENKVSNQDIIELEKFLKGHIQLNDQLEMKKYMDSVHDHTTAQLFYKLSNKRTRKHG
jgi:spore coat protein SA